MDELIKARDLQLTHATSEVGAEFVISAGDLWAIQGEGESGKTTLLKTLLGMVAAKRGEIYLLGEAIHSCSHGRLHDLRCAVGVMFSHGGLIGAWSIRENLVLPLIYHGVMDVEQAEVCATDLMVEAGLPAEWLDHIAAQLTHHQAQAVALLRATIAQPRVVVIDGLEEETLRWFSQSPFHILDELLEQGSAVLVYSVCDLSQWWARSVTGQLHVDSGNISVVKDETVTRESQC